MLESFSFPPHLANRSANKSIQSLKGQKIFNIIIGMAPETALLPILFAELDLDMLQGCRSYEPWDVNCIPKLT